MNKIIIYDYPQNDEHHSLTAEITENGDLKLEGYDCGKSVKDFLGDFDHEYWLIIESENVPCVLLHLIKEHFNSDVKFMEWLKEKNISFNFSSYT